MAFRVLDSTTFLPYESLTAASPGLALWYRKGALGAVTAITESDLAAITSAHSDGGIKHKDDGSYRLDLPDAAIPTAEHEVTEWGGTATGYVVLGGALVGKPAELGGAAQTGDSFARIGAAGAGLTAVGDTAGTTTLLSRITALLQTKAEADTAHGLLATSASLTAAQAALAALIAALNDLSSAEVEALIAAGAGATPATFWQYTGAGGRTLSQSMIAVLSSMIEGSAITITRGDNVSVSITGLGNLAGRTGLWFTVKANPSKETDLQARIQIAENDGLLRLNGKAADNPAGGSITVDDEANGDITIALAAGVSAALASTTSWHWDAQVAQPGPGIWTPRAGSFSVTADVTRAT